MASQPPRATCGDQPRKSAQAGSSPCPPSMKQKASGRSQRAANVGESPTMPTTDDSRPAVGDGAAPVRQRVDAADLGIDEIWLVVLPSRLVLLRTAVMVDGEQRRRPWLRRPRPGRRSISRTRPRSRRRLSATAAGRSAWPARRAAANSASPSSSGMKPRVLRAVSKSDCTRAESRPSPPGNDLGHQEVGCAGRPQGCRPARPARGNRRPR